jgi:hypothetical protein
MYKPLAPIVKSGYTLKIDLHYSGYSLILEELF